MKKSLKITVLFSAMLLLNLLFLVGCKQKPQDSPKSMPEITITAFSIDGQSALGQKAASVNNGLFEITADSEISMLNVACAGSVPVTYPCSGKTVKGVLPAIGGKETTVQFVLHAEGKKDKTISLNLNRFAFTNMSINNEHLDLSVTDGSYIFETENKEVLLNIACTSADENLTIKVKAGKNAEKTAVKYGNQYIAKIDGITADAMLVQVIAENTKKQKTAYSFKIKQSDIIIGHFSIDDKDVHFFDNPNSAIDIEEGKFNLTATSAIESLEIDIAGKKKTYKAKGASVSGIIENLEAGKNLTKFTVTAAGKKTKTFALTLNVKPIEFTKINGVNLTVQDGSFVAISGTSAYKLEIELNQKVKSVKVKAGNAPAVEAVSIGSSKYTSLVKNITDTPTMVTITAESSFNRTASYSFKIKLKDKNEIELESFTIGDKQINKDAESIEEAVVTLAEDFTIKVSCDLEKVDAEVNGKAKTYQVAGSLVAGKLEGLKDGDNKVKFTLTSKAKKIKSFETVIKVETLEFTDIHIKNGSVRYADLSKKDGSSLLIADSKSVGLIIESAFEMSEIILQVGKDQPSKKFTIHNETQTQLNITGITSKPIEVKIIAKAYGRNRKDGEYTFKIKKEGMEITNIRFFRRYYNDLNETTIKVTSSDFENSESSTEKHFTIYADCELKEAELEINGKVIKYPASGMEVKGDIPYENIVEGRQAAKLTLISKEGNIKLVKNFIINFEKQDIEFYNVSVETASITEKADLKKKDGSCLITVQEDSANLYIDAPSKCTVMVRVGATAAQKAEKQGLNYHVKIENITEKPTDVIITATRKYFKPVEYKFKIVKGELIFKVSDIQVGNISVDIKKALSSSGYDAQFDTDDVINMGAVPIEIRIQGEKIKKVTTTSTEGFIKDALEKTDTVVKHKAVCFAEGSIDDSTAQVSYARSVTNFVTFKLEFDKQKPITVKLNLTANAQWRMPERDYASIGGIYGSFWRYWTLSTLADWFRLKFFKKDMLVMFEAKKGDVTIYNKEGDDWNANLVTSRSKFSVGKFDSTPETKQVDLIFAASNCGAVKVPFDMETLGEYGPSFGIWTEQGAGINGVRSVMEATKYNIDALLKDDGYTYELPADELETAGQLRFYWGSGERITNAEITKYESDSNSSSYTEVNIDNKDRLIRDLIERNYCILENQERLGFQKDKKYKYVIKVTFEENGYTVTKTVTAIFSIE